MSVCGPGSGIKPTKKVGGRGIIFFFQFLKIIYIAVSHTHFLLMLLVELQVTDLCLAQLVAHVDCRASDGSEAAYVKMHGWSQPSFN